MDTSITSDGVTVWVNGTCGLIGRFGVRGVDIHRLASEQGVRGECLFCTHAVTTSADWDRFVIKMHELYSVSIPSSYKPHRVR